MNSNNNTPRSIFRKEGKYILAIFLAAVALFTWIASNFFSPLTEMKQSMALMERDIAEIKENHLKHIEKLYEKTEANQETIQELLERLNYLLGMFDPYNVK